MREQQIHSAFMAWLKKNGLFYIHSTFGKKATMTANAPDFVVLHCGRCLLIEIKTARGALTRGQHLMFARIQMQSGMIVHIARSCEEAVSAVQTWVGVEKRDSGALTSGPSVSDRDIAAAMGSSLDEHLFVATFGGKDFVFRGNPGGSAWLVRLATTADLINLKRR